MSGYDFEDVGSHDAVRISGRVKWFDAGKGYGFVVPDDPSKTDLKDVLLHVTSLRNSGRESALEGAVIICDAIRRPKGWFRRFTNWTRAPPRRRARFAGRRRVTTTAVATATTAWAGCTVGRGVRPWPPVRWSGPR